MDRLGDDLFVASLAAVAAVFAVVASVLPKRMCSVGYEQDKTKSPRGVTHCGLIQRYFDLEERAVGIRIGA